MEETHSISLRQWLGRIRVPAVAAGTTLIGLNATVSPANDKNENKLAGSKDILIMGARVLTPAAAFLRVEGTASKDIVVNGGNVNKAAQHVLFENGAKKESVKLLI